MTDFTFATTIQTFLQDNLTITPDGSKRPCVLLSDESPSDDSGGSIDSGIIRIVSQSFVPIWVNGANEDQVISFELTFEYSITTATTRAEYIDVIEDIKQQCNEQNNSSNPSYLLEFHFDDHPAARHSYAEFQLIMYKHFQDATA